MDEFEFAMWLEGELRKRNMTNVQLARRTGICPSAITHYLCYDRSPTLRTLLAILDALHMHIEIVHND
jgi:DNA-binding phage protein